MTLLLLVHMFHFLGARVGGGLSLLQILAILAIVWVVLRVSRQNREDRRAARQVSRRPPAPPPPRRRPPPPPPAPFKVKRRPTVNVAQLVMASLFFFITVPVWAISSLGDLVAIPVHLVVGTITFMIAFLASLVGAAPRRLWRLTGRQFTHAGRAALSIGVRLLETFGLGGILDRLKEDAKEDERRQRLAAEAAAPPRFGAPGFVAPGPGHRIYPFEDRYRIESHLGSGGSTARLFVVRRMMESKPMGEPMVLKYFDMGMGSRLEEVIRESRGMQVAREMGIVLDHHLAEDHFYYVMPYYEGETLTRAAARLHRHLMAEEGLEVSGIRTCLGWTAELLRILDGYHRHGVIHKDVKPDNVIVTDRGIRLVDLGLLTPLTSAMTLTTHGTEYFRDPEMVKLAVQGKRVRDVDAVRFDVYSTGAVLYYLLEGSFPACGPLSRFSRPVPMALSWVVSRAMAEGAKRYPGIAAMRADLEEIMRRGDAGEDLATLPVRHLPSFRGFPGGAPEVSEPPIFARRSPDLAAYEPITAASPKTVRPMPTSFPKRRRMGGAFLASLLILTVLGWFAVSTPRAEHMRSMEEQQRRVIDQLESDVARDLEDVVPMVLERPAAVPPRMRVAREIEDFRIRSLTALRRVDETADFDGVPVLLVPATRADEDLAAGVRGVLSDRKIPWHPSSSLAQAVAEWLSQNPGDGDGLRKMLLERLDGDTLPMVAWLEHGRFTGYYDLAFAGERESLTGFYR